MFASVTMHLRHTYSWHYVLYSKYSIPRLSTTEHPKQFSHHLYSSRQASARLMALSTSPHLLHVYFPHSGLHSFSHAILSSLPFLLHPHPLLMTPLLPCSKSDALYIDKALPSLLFLLDDQNTAVTKRAASAAVSLYPGVIKVHACAHTHTHTRTQTLGNL